MDRLETLTFLEKRHNLRIDQAAAHLGLGRLYWDQYLIQKALEQLTKANDLTQELIIIEDSPGQQDRLGVILATHGEILKIHEQATPEDFGVILATHGEILNIPEQATPEDVRSALNKQQRAVAIFRQLEQTTIGPLRTDTPQTDGSITSHGRHTRESRTLQRIPRGKSRVQRHRQKSAYRKQHELPTPTSENSCQR